jgi:ABC-type glycerol-3-phosphate transport system substrate-binding protein
MSIKKLVSLFLSVVLCLVSTGCGNNIRSERDELIMWLVGSEAQAKIINKLGRDFKEQTGIEVMCQAISWGDAHSKYLTSIAGEVTPDIGTMGLTWGMEFGELGALVNLKEEFSEDFKALESKIFPSLLESTRIGDRVYGLPFDISVSIMYYRNDIIRTPPRNWDELLAQVKDLESREKGMIIDWGSLEWIGFSPFLWQAGGTYYNEDYTRAAIASPEAEKALEFFGGLYKIGVPRTKVPLEQGMRTGDYPLAISGNWKIISLMAGAPEIKGKWSVAMMPKGPTGDRTAFIGGRIFSIFKESPKRKEAWEFLKFLFKTENQLKIYEASLETEDSYLPPNMDTWKKLPMKIDHKMVLEQQAREAKGPPPVLGWDSSARFVNEAIQLVVLRNADPGKVLEEAERKMQSELEISSKR